jgi:hypothetical protein
MVEPSKFAFMVGVDHRIQYSRPGDGPIWAKDVRSFQRYLVDEGRRHHIDLLAEEFNQKALATSGAATSTGLEAARHIPAKHLFCDPDDDERATLGVSTDEQRETVWLARLQSFGATRPMFVCGDTHVDTFGGKLVASGFHVEVLSRGWGHDWLMKDF